MTGKQRQQNQREEGHWGPRPGLPHPCTEGQGVEGRGSKLGQTLPRPFGFLPTAQASVSGSASGNYVAYNKSFCSLSLRCLI